MRAHVGRVEEEKERLKEERECACAELGRLKEENVQVLSLLALYSHKSTNTDT